MSNLDRIDRKLLQLLQNNGRLSNKELATQVELAPSTCLERMRRLSQDGVIKGIHADVETQALGIGLQAIYFIELTKHRREVVETFQAEVLQIPEVIAIYLIAGRYDFLVHVAVRDTQHLRDLALDTFTNRPEVTRIETALIFNYARCFELPNYLEDDL
ncbi:ArsR family transcriptional regulator [Scytonema hofmannii PCC 7110]|uniref:ArsR family transcriptional regulator n=1 Tax=Scytonema hofmannii PCC 7110 TaxID=128403 RepID=A0A139XHV6_9CYAN|nr:Lrp/AsnC family transcriptional regulator [Scytonema hofmannii]KYC41819.1 ArsR family transcriptional regulator [Scytonema hofmannii PCC 7110]KYC44267.1 ArsR family transcriptional regulator [Scytonema hofmannii PCC 7110]